MGCGRTPDGEITQNKSVGVVGKIACPVPKIKFDNRHSASTETRYDAGQGASEDLLQVGCFRFLVQLGGLHLPTKCVPLTR